MKSPLGRAIVSRLTRIRTETGITRRSLEISLGLGPGWIEYLESGDFDLTLDDVAALASALHVSPSRLLETVTVADDSTDIHLVCDFTAIENRDGVLIEFPYGKYDASYLLDGANMIELTNVVAVLREELARPSSRSSNAAIKRAAVTNCFLTAVDTWPHINPSDLWYFVVYRAYVDRYSHPSSFADLDFGQSWKRTGGWALEQVMVQHYGPYLKNHGINLSIKSGDEKRRFLEQLNTAHRIEPAKVDVLLTGNIGSDEVCFGVVHVKTSFAERRTDDVPMSEALVRAGYTSPLWTMDAKATPGPHPINRGELGRELSVLSDTRSAKRKDIEVDGYFSACFSYNYNTIPTPKRQDATARVVVCDFSDVDDSFSRFLITEWKRFRSRQGAD